MSAPPTQRAQLRILTARYGDVLLGDIPTLLLLVGQAPAIGALCAVVWGTVEEGTPSLWFVMALSSVWFGCINACREVVKERAILERERMFGVSLPAYVGAKLGVLSVLGLVQVVLLQGAVEWSIALRGPYLLQTFALWLGCLAGTALGLLVSAIATRQERAVGVVPLLLLPQILFSEFAVPDRHFTGALELVRSLMPVHWTYTIFRSCAEVEPRWGSVMEGILVLPITTAGLALLTTLALLRRPET
jgi:ABC-type multidrug transport system permease subunit